MATSVGASEDTVTVTLAVRPEAAAVMVAEPSASPVTTPELLTAATAEASQEKVRPAVMGDLVPSLWTAATTSCPTPPTANRRGLGVTAIADTVALLEPPQPGRRSPGRTARATSKDCLRSVMCLPRSSVRDATLFDTRTK